MVSKSHPAVQRDLNECDPGESIPVLIDDVDRYLGYPRGKDVAQLLVSVEDRVVHEKEQFVVETDDGDRYIFARHAGERWTFEAHEKADASWNEQSRSTRSGRLPTAVERVADLVLRDVRE